MINEAGREEIIVIKRGGESEEGHHGGAWKIAFADFMTAMMALFLVLWLINAANEETKKSVASYFNPVKLVDRNRSTKGLEDANGPQETGDAEVSGKEEEAKEVRKTEGGPERGDGHDSKLPSDAELQANPYGVLAEIAAQPPVAQTPSVIVQVSPGDTGSAPGAAESDAFRDPFDPDFWRSEIAPVTAKDEHAGDGTEVAMAQGANQPNEAALDHASRTASTGLDGETDHAGMAADGDAAKPGHAPDGEKTNPGAAEDGMAGKPGAAEDGTRKAPGNAPEGEADGASRQAADDAGEELRDELRKVLAGVAGIDPELANSISVTQEKDGTLISLTDEWTIPMFGVGSAVPSRDLVLAMDKIAAVLASKKGALRIYGHTDARPFKGGKYDNWQLSVARAQSAYFMLVRGGIPQARISQVSGFADSRLRDPDNPEAAGNRRIEIFLEGA